MTKNNFDQNFFENRSWWPPQNLFWECFHAVNMENASPAGFHDSICQNDSSCGWRVHVESSSLISGESVSHVVCPVRIEDHDAFVCALQHGLPHPMRYEYRPLTFLQDSVQASLNRSNGIISFRNWDQTVPFQWDDVDFETDCAAFDSDFAHVFYVVRMELRLHISIVFVVDDSAVVPKTDSKNPM